MNRFSKFNPIVNILFYLITFVFIFSFNNPFMTMISFVCGSIYCFYLIGKNYFKTVGYLLFLVVIVGVFNMIFAHYGTTILFTIKDMEFTLQSLVYGLNQGLVLSTVIIWFTSFNKIIDSDKICYMFSSMPKTALIFSMVLGFIPNFKNKHKDIKESFIALNGGNNDQTKKDKFKTSLSIFSSLITYSLESSIITTQSMEARGFKQNTTYNKRYKFNLYDLIVIFFMILISGILLYLIFEKQFKFYFEPNIQIVSFNIFGAIIFAILQLLPFILDIQEDIKWKISQSKI